MKDDRNRQREELAAEITERIRPFVPVAEGYQNNLTTAMAYSVFNGGKRLRPMLLLLTYRACGGDVSRERTLVDPFLAGIEMIHCYSLVHDDLPAMDNDRYRRGNLTTHAKFGHAMGILAGDGLLNAAFEAALQAEEPEGSSGRVMRALRIMAEKAGARGMAGGQSVDVEMTGKAMDEDVLRFVYRLKTGALLEASMQIGAVLAGASEEIIAAVGDAAERVGMAFQIQDDILDVASTMQELGKPIGSDEKNHKTTFVTLHGMRESRETEERLSEEALAIIGGLPGGERREPLAELIASLVGRTV